MNTLRLTSLNYLRTFAIALSFLTAQDLAVAQLPPSFNGDFENGLGSSLKLESCCSHSFSTVPIITRRGSYGARFELRRTDPDVATSRRVEAKTAFPLQQEMWFNLNYLFPQDYTPEESRELIAQWHDLPDKGEPWQMPSLNLWVSNNRIYLTNRWQLKKIGDLNKFDGQLRYDLGDIELNRWTNIVVHIRWALDGSGLIELWRDGVKKVNQVGPNRYHDDLYPYLKFGIYKYDWKIKPQASKLNTRVLYIDDVRVGFKDSSYAKISTVGTLYITDPFTSTIDRFKVITGGAWLRRLGRYDLVSPVQSNGSVTTNLTLNQKTIPTNFNLKVDAQVNSPSSAGDYSIVFNNKDLKNFSYINFSLVNRRGSNGIFTVKNGALTTLAIFTSPIQASKWDRLELKQVGSRIDVWKNSKLIGQATTNMPISGRVGFSSSGSNVSFDNLLVYQLPQ
ncbi:MAG: polysaccharide lyase [Nostoc sp. ChiSLP02]|nr:polysaccharide lyase [Nostoc sp. DedSLP05]MDZ8099933.1 polysaccharide lyase [Nostoc sp. DedSLP01]MDZ8187672.1 polysaccharide lyase [Nostoc sp. ChiSLP02]